MSGTTPYRFGDLLALARRTWVLRMGAELAARGYPDYRASDAGSVRLLLRGPTPVGRLGTALGVTRQAARKVASGLEARGLATVEPDPADARMRNVVLTEAGAAYGRAIVEVVAELNGSLVAQVTSGDLASADAVLRAVVADGPLAEVAELVPMPEGPEGRGPGDRPRGGGRR